MWQTFSTDIFPSKDILKRDAQGFTNKYKVRWMQSSLKNKNTNAYGWLFLHHSRTPSWEDSMLENSCRTESLAAAWDRGFEEKLITLLSCEWSVFVEVLSDVWPALGAARWAAFGRRSGCDTASIPGATAGGREAETPAEVNLSARKTPRVWSGPEPWSAGRNPMITLFNFLTWHMMNFNVKRWSWSWRTHRTNYPLTWRLFSSLISTNKYYIYREFHKM